MKKIGYIIFLSLLIVPITINADDYQKNDSIFGDKSNDFFGNNNALTPFGNNQDSSGFKKDNLFENKSDYFGNDKNEDRKGKKEEKKEKKDNIQNIFGTDKNMEMVSGNKIIALGLVVNSINKKHFLNVMEKFRKTVDAFDLDAGHVYVNGFLDFDTDPDTLPLIARGSSISYHFTMPEEFNISISPTWIIQTSEGRILLEGISNLNRYINKKGEFIEDGVPVEQRMNEREDNSLKGGSIFF